MKHVGEANLQQFVLDELDTESHLAIERHMATCAECRRRLRVERQLDEWLLESVPASVPGAAEQSLARLWATVDHEQTESLEKPSDDGPGVVNRRSVWRRSLPLWWPAAAAAGVVLMLWLVDGPSTEAPVGDEQAALSLLAVASKVSTSEPVDPGRLAAAQQRTADVLVAARTQWPGSKDEFARACDREFAGLRREGWPVASLVRGWALGDDETVAEAALQYASREPATWGVLAAALDGDGTRVDTVLELLRRDIAPVADSLAIIRALERRATGRSPDGRSVALLAAASGARSSRALTRMLDRRLDRALADSGSVLAVESLLQIVAVLPTDPALGALMLAGGDQALEAVMRGAFLACVKTDRAGCVLALRASLGKRERCSVLLDWSLAADLVELVPSLLTRLEDDPGDRPVLTTVVAMGGLEAAAGLALLWEAESGSRAEPFLDGLADVLQADTDLSGELGRQLAESGSERVRALADVLPIDQVQPLLMGCLAGQPAGPDVAGHQAALLVMVARMGRPQDAGALFEWIASRPDDDPLLALAWAAAARLDGARAGEAWGALGHDPARLRLVARAANSRFRSASMPSDRLLTPLSRALQTPPNRTNPRASGE